MNTDKTQKITPQQIQLALDFESLSISPSRRGHNNCSAAHATDPQDVSWAVELGYNRCLQISLDEIGLADPTTRAVCKASPKIEKYPIGVDDQCLG